MSLRLILLKLFLPRIRSFTNRFTLSSFYYWRYGKWTNSENRLSECTKYLQEDGNFNDKKETWTILTGLIISWCPGLLSTVTLGALSSMSHVVCQQIICRNKSWFTLGADKQRLFGMGKLVILQSIWPWECFVALVADKRFFSNMGEFV